MTPARYLKHFKLEEAKKLVENSNISIGEIMLRIGVNDESHFRRDFKKTYGVTLTECRNLRYKKHKEEYQNQNSR